VIPLGKFQNKWGPVRYDAAGTTGTEEDMVVRIV